MTDRRNVARSQGDDQSTPAPAPHLEKGRAGRTRGGRPRPQGPRVSQTPDGLVISGLQAPSGGAMDVADQCRAALDLGTELLAAHGFAMRDVTQLVCIIGDADGFPGCFPVLRHYFASASPVLTLIWLKDGGAGAPAITFDLVVHQPLGEDDVL
ncbi:translation initiation inhibitor YjgF [Acetobacter sp. TBRC 12305]|uniref:Translation initiation inhibitor YjgF n=1 Tax=Acetobacter garciniae TaxID=2817435 RepID=A0A939KRD1_9PROT|nr:translation initiation inhibitor YjgF [Acetobacter garciniae]MBO1324926.1 translation initiation inhibitor YjgF [Acetobacter garciniae]MBX0344617.1 translation initiation inhibitor YjgF [Acetobacter garciniae]